MRKLIDIIEGLKINSHTKINHISNNYKPEDFCYPTETKEGKEYMWFKWWKYLVDNGPMSKRDLLRKFNLVTTSYSTMFAKLSKRNIIVPKAGKLEAISPDNWRPNIK